MSKHGARTPEEILARKKAQFPKERTLGTDAARLTMLAMYRQGASHADVAKAMNVSINTVHKEMQVDPGWKKQVQDAMSTAFLPMYKHAQTLALALDEEGTRAGSMKAMELIFRFYSKVLDRDHQMALLERKIEATTEVMGKAARIPTLTSPGQVAELLAALKDRDAVEAELVEDDTDAED